MPRQRRPAPAIPDALGTERVLAVNAATTPQVGRKHFATTLPLARKEVVLTFDDGPWPGPTDRVLDALRHECVKATFFLLGRNAASFPKLVRREVAEGHTVAHHSFLASLAGSTSVRRRRGGNRPRHRGGGNGGFRRDRIAPGNAVFPLSRLCLVSSAA